MAPHGVMFHHFHDGSHPPGQGSISCEQLERMIEHLGRQRILPAREWFRRAVAGELREDDLCFTFDDNLLCQYDVALPVLERHGITAFWFVYTSVLQGNVEKLEVYRWFRMTQFADVDDFYRGFHAAVRASDQAEIVETALRRFDPATFLAGFDFYTPEDRRFRFVRDEALGPDRYERIMDGMIAAARIDVPAVARNLWMDDQRLRHLHAAGHIVGLHSHTHPTRLGELPPGRQRVEYQANADHLRELLGEPPVAMSHPCNSYSPGTLAILRELGVKLGFRANMTPGPWSILEHPREDHANILREMRP